MSLAGASKARQSTPGELTLVIKPRTVIVNRIQKLSSYGTYDGTRYQQNFRASDVHNFGIEDTEVIVKVDRVLRRHSRAWFSIVRYPELMV